MYITFVFDWLFPLPMCISRPSFAKTLLIRLSPSIISSLILKKKAPSLV